MINKKKVLQLNFYKVQELLQLLWLVNDIIKGRMFFRWPKKISSKKLFHNHQINLPKEVKIEKILKKLIFLKNQQPMN